MKFDVLMALNIWNMILPFSRQKIDAVCYTKMLIPSCNYKLPHCRIS
jgi:hypothetical protein